MALPARYAEPWVEPFEERCRSAIYPRARILDVGGGRRPSLPRASRPPGCFYVGLDTSAQELLEAGPAAYDKVYVGSVSERISELEQSFDLVASWQTLEHVRPLEAALANAHAYLRPGGRLVAMASGAFSAFAVASRLIPNSLVPVLLQRLLGREPETVFPACYDRCWHGALVKLLERWDRAEVVPFYRGANYLAFSKPLARAYLAYENW